ncbi:DUF3951 domain-containing protein [Domibacillus sp. DTU_2020_1001157_1_SI_ALB_TIR_016]|uniref:DUF3951 domain-containing protein n=1 Tax=Domibacillus sp. DTU_2020_1001157_1_SI_ALB_TIR_016 TaxID=3077789 RepID=UPI0028ED395D|nr:DUF3951 domain-containing protein [Domibacillus sp. DTU_2020_1001157_1_SI_ALB_TIR_016]WNS78212.1 DUF3951 domain-containing protein [Domibacillus sp. DTU_2020_1001157_1_SI_ALB_TIR_016]
MNVAFYAPIIFTLLIVALVITVVFKMIWKKELPSHTYTPFDYIAGQTIEEFHDEKEERSREDEPQGNG